MLRTTSAILLAALLALAATQTTASDLPPAPEWQISKWFNGDGTTLNELKGKVVIIEFFQLWCPGCNRFSIPLMEQWREKYADHIKAGKLVLISIHTVFEGHDVQNNQRLKSFLQEKGIHHLVGVDKQLPNSRLPETMKAYRTRGTPEMAILDQQGRIRFQHFGSFNPKRAEALLEQLLTTPPSS